MTGQPFPAAGAQRLAFANHSAVSGPHLGDEDRAEIGLMLTELLFDLHQSGGLRPDFVERGGSWGLEVALRVPGAGDVLARLRSANGHYELSLSSDYWEDMLVLRENEGRLGDLYRYYLSWHEDQQRRAKDRLVQGLRELRSVNDWDVRHYEYS
jgi:hypothetical protein